ncbi:CBS domain-containing protein [Streptacidiphilus sp. MAP12-16]|uniref:CBS domain-containing protein n=1 Tax=Streptacidiphilus sp. MAP12-16 TaxID=3156300 RepID=UPI003512072D
MRATAHGSTADLTRPVVSLPEPDPSAAGGLPRRTLVGDLMTREVIAVDPRTGFAAVVAALREHHHDMLPVVDPERRVLGTVCSSDLLAKLAVSALPSHASLVESRQIRALRRRAPAVNARELMTSPPLTVTTTTGAAEAALVAVRHRVHHLPVVDEQQHLTGMVCLCDLLVALHREDDDIRSEVLYLAVAHTAGVDRSTLIVDCKDGHVVLNATAALRSQAEALAERVRAVEGVVDLLDSLRWHTDDTRTPTANSRS